MTGRMVKEEGGTWPWARRREETRSDRLGHTDRSGKGLGGGAAKVGRGETDKGSKYLITVVYYYTGLVLLIALEET